MYKSDKIVFGLSAIALLLISISMFLDVSAEKYGISFWFSQTNSWTSYALFPEIVAIGIILYIFYEILNDVWYRSIVLVLIAISLAVIFLGEVYRRWGDWHFNVVLSIAVFLIVFCSLLLFYIRHVPKRRLRGYNYE